MMNVVSLFSGIGAYEKALRNIGIDTNIVNYCEILEDKSKAYSLIHNVPESLNLWDVTNIDYSKVGNVDLLCYSPPCKSYSISGNKLGMDDIRGTLFYNALYFIEVKKPKYCVMENVGNLPRNFKDVFDDMLVSLDKAGYNNYWKIINASEFIPQNRERVYLVSIRKDIDEKKFVFPIGTNNQNWWEVINLSDMRSLTKRQKDVLNDVLGCTKENKMHIEGKPEISNSVITFRQSGLRFQSNRVYPTITAFYGTGGGNFTIIAYNGEILGGITPKNCFKLMGFDFEDCEILEKNGFARSNLYRMAGDSICVPVLEAIFKNLF